MTKNKDKDLDKLGHGFREWHPRIWHGMGFMAWVRLVYGRVGKIPVRRYPLAISITIVSLLNSLSFAISRLILGRKVSKIEFVGDPVFVLGFWRSGTTWLNELLVLDPHTGYPNTFQCFAPKSIMLAGIFQNLIGKIIPNKRPMDAVELEMQNPQEDEFAILNLGLETPYRYLAFPSLIEEMEANDEFWPELPERKENWNTKWLFFLKTIQFLNPGKRLVLKSPLHTARVGVILSLIPNAKFIHISRDPKSIIGSSQKAHDAMRSTQSLEYVEEDEPNIAKESVNSLNEMYQVFFRENQELTPQQIINVKYEDLRRDTVGELSRIYSTLELGDFESVQSHFLKFIESKKEYKPDEYDLPEDVHTMIAEECKDYSRAFGYPT